MSFSTNKLKENNAESQETTSVTLLSFLEDIRKIAHACSAGGHGGEEITLTKTNSKKQVSHYSSGISINPETSAFFVALGQYLGEKSNLLFPEDERNNMPVRKAKGIDFLLDMIQRLTYAMGLSEERELPLPTKFSRGDACLKNATSSPFANNIRTRKPIFLPSYLINLLASATATIKSKKGRIDLANVFEDDGFKEKTLDMVSRARKVPKTESESIYQKK